MPLIESSNYKPSFLFRFGHINTIFSNLTRKVKRPPYKRIRLDTPDNDFLDLDHSSVGGELLVILTHGLEGNADREYIRSMVNAVNEQGWDALALNLRGCSDELNSLYSSYHSGKTDDLDLVVQYAKKNLAYTRIILVGYSLGGNITLKYVGEKGKDLDPAIISAAAISVPVSLEDSASQLAKRSNLIYMKRFVKMLKPKLSEKSKRFPTLGVEEEKIKDIKDFYDFDELYTAPAHGFSSAKDYWEKSSSRSFLSTIHIPTLLINALDDPFLADRCYPYKEAQENSKFYFEASKYGGHVGFGSRPFQKGIFWHEKRMISFFKENI